MSSSGLFFGCLFPLTHNSPSAFLPFFCSLFSMDFPSVLDSLLVFPPDECSTPTSPSFLHDPFNNEQGSSSHTSLDHTASSSNDFNSYHDPWAGYPSGEYADYDGAQGNLMGVDLEGMAGGTGGATLELMDIGMSRPSRSLCSLASSIGLAVEMD
jgi:hypothetical protein